MIVYSEMIESEKENKGDLHVTFKNGSTYCYKDVLFEDYILFIGGGTDASQGKTLNKVIKTKYEFIKLEDKSIDEILNELNKLTEEDKHLTYFVSGQRDLTDMEFDFHYAPILMNILEEDKDCHIIVGDCKGCDIMTQDFLIDVLGVDPNRITVYCVNNSPNNVNKEIINFKGSFSSHEEKDIAMTKNSMKDIAYVRDWKELSGTAQNILRRNCFNI